MQPSDNILSFIKNEEGLRLQTYNDGAGNLTVGYGHKLPKGDLTKSVTLAVAEKLFENDIAPVVNLLNQNIKVALTQNEFDALVSFVFNCGWDAFYHSSIYLYLSKGMKVEAASWICRWCHEGTTAIEGLLTRRVKETCIYLGIPIDKVIPVTEPVIPIVQTIESPQLNPKEKIAMNVITDVETAVAFAQALEKLSANGALQADVAALISDVNTLKTLYADVKARVASIVSQLGPEMAVLLPAASAASAATAAKPAVASVA
jgi:lysozyme